MNLIEMYNIIKEKEFVDLTHSFGPDIPHYPDLPNMQKEDLFTTKNDGFWVEKMTLVGQWGTHVDSPRYFADGLRKLDEIKASGHETPDTDSGIVSSSGELHVSTMF